MNVIESIKNNLNIVNKNILINDVFSDLNENSLYIFRNLPPSILYEYALKENCIISDKGALIAYSGEKTGRSPKDKRFVINNKLEKTLWLGKDSPNNTINIDDYNIQKKYAIKRLSDFPKLYVFDGYAGWNNENKIKLRVYCTSAYHAVFCQNIFIKPTPSELENFGEPDYVIYNVGDYNCIDTETYTSNTGILINLINKEIVILGTRYAGEMKKSIFTVFHYIMPQKNILSLHSSVNVSKIDYKDVSIFFGLSGTGKTTLSSDPKRFLIGDDEHCWTDNGIFNIEGGCYAKCINLNKEKEKGIYNAIKFGTVLENVVIKDEFEPDYYDNSITNNIRACYSIENLDNCIVPCISSVPKNIILLTCDAFGLLPLVSKLNTNQTLYYFLNGYTTKIVGTEQGVTEPQVTFSSCFGEAFLPCHPTIYANLLKEKIEKCNTKCWLVNTGWVGGSVVTNGKRCNLDITRKIIDAIHSGELNTVEYEILPIFNLYYPKQCFGVDYKLLNPRLSWNNDGLYYNNLECLACKFIKNFTRFNNKTLMDYGPKL
jgi:phosphoenolpyruvate carboxykinase (ATP)